MELASRQAGKISPGYRFFQLKPGQKRVTKGTQGRNRSPGPTQEGLARWPGQCLLSPSLSSEEQIHRVLVTAFIITKPDSLRGPSSMMDEQHGHSQSAYTGKLGPRPCLIQDCFMYVEHF